MTERNEAVEELFELGAASTETKGPGGVATDTLISLQQPIGISED